jgi:hypothetical protein
VLYGGQCGNGNSINLCKLSKYHHWEGWERYKHRAVAESEGTRQISDSNERSKDMWGYFSFDGELFPTATECYEHDLEVKDEIMNSLYCSEL